MTNCQCDLPYGSECGEDDPRPGECHTRIGPTKSIRAKQSYQSYHANSLGIQKLYIIRFCSVYYVFLGKWEKGMKIKNNG
jgi:hypothetical protein